MILTLLLGGVAAYAVYTAHALHTELVARNDAHMSMAIRYGQFQYHISELADSTLDLTALDADLGSEYCDGYEQAHSNLVEELQRLLVEDGKRNYEAYQRECGGAA